MNGAVCEAPTIAARGWTFLPGHATRARFDPDGTALSGPAWDAFAASWDDLGPDLFMADGGRYRRRRHAVFAATPGDTAIPRAPDRPHFQTTEFNRLNGGMDRRFDPVTPAVATGPALTAILRGARTVFDALSPASPWDIEVHQFRIEALADAVGRPTPEGMHRDGVDYVLVALVSRRNVAGGVTAIRVDGRDGEESFALADPLDTVLLDDHRVWHGVTPVRPLAGGPAHRDVLVVTFRRTKS